MSDFKPYFAEDTKLVFSTLSSTHQWVKKCLSSFSTSSYIAVRADLQTEGHGQFKRRWISPEGGIWASLCLDLSTTFQMNMLAMVLASSIISVLVARGVYPKLKIPNDLLLNGGKLAGVLVEVCQTQTKVICSFGININIDPSQLKNVDQPTASLSSATEKTWPLEELYEEIQDQFQRDFRSFEKMGYAPFSPWEEEWKY